MRDDRRTRIGMIAAAIVLMPFAAVVAQYALDNNLMAGSNGYNRPMRGSSTFMAHQRYAPTKPLYTTGRSGQLIYSSNNAFFPTSRYTATGYNANYRSAGYQSRFRYQGQY